MSATTANPVPAIFFQPGDNQFKLNDRSKKLHVTLNLKRPGPLVQGSTAQGPILQYEGPEGTLSFSGDQITQESSELGKMYTVTLNIVPDLRASLFTIVLPSVVHKDPSQI